jgi:hypothetical protein
MLPSRFPEVQVYPMLRQMLAAQVDMQIKDVRALLRLPLEGAGLGAGCNFSTAAILLNLLSGTSVCFMDASLEARADRGNRKTRFCNLLAAYYPTEAGLAKEDLISALYDSTRNPLAHALGFALPEVLPSTRVAILKSPLTYDQIIVFESSIERPSWVPPTVTKSDLTGGASEFQISVPSLYWGLHRTLHRLFSDSNQASLSESVAASLRASWTKYVVNSAHATDSVNVR